MHLMEKPTFVVSDNYAEVENQREETLHAGAAKRDDGFHMVTSGHLDGSGGYVVASRSPSDYSQQDYGIVDIPIVDQTAPALASGGPSVVNGNGVFEEISRQAADYGRFAATVQRPEPLLSDPPATAHANAAADFRFVGGRVAVDRKSVV